MLVLSIAFSFVLPIRVIIQSPYTYLGVLVIGFGIAMNLWSDGLFKKSKTTVFPFGSPTALMVSGPFRLSRNPMYLGMAAILLGIAILLGTLVTFVFPIIFLVIIESMFIPIEEKNLEKTFGKEYEDYRHKVRRWI